MSAIFHYICTKQINSPSTQFFCNPLLVSVKSFYLVAATVPTPKFQFSASWFEIWSLISQSNQGLLSSKLFHTFLLLPQKNTSTLLRRNPVDVNLSAPLLIKRIVVDPIVTPHIKYINTSPKFVVVVELRTRETFIR